MPATPAGLLTRLRHYALLTWCAQHPGGGCETVDKLVAGEAESLLQDPVTSQVRAAAYRVLAALPGVRLLGQMKDPLGRVGYGLGTGGNSGIAVIDPQTGVLLLRGNGKRGLDQRNTGTAPTGNLARAQRPERLTGVTTGRAAR